MYEEIFLFSSNPVADYLILFVIGIIIIGWYSSWVGVKNIIKGWPILSIILMMIGLKICCEC